MAPHSYNLHTSLTRFLSHTPNLRSAQFVADLTWAYSFTKSTWRQVSTPWDVREDVAWATDDKVRAAGFSFHLFFCFFALALFSLSGVSSTDPHIFSLIVANAFHRVVSFLSGRFVVDLIRTCSDAR